VKISDLAPARLRERLARDGLKFQTGPFVVRLQTSLATVAEGVEILYGEFPLLLDEEFADFHISLRLPRTLRRWIRPQVIYTYNGECPFPPLPFTQAFPFFETGLNWSIYSEVFNYLIIHAAAVERGGHAAILPAPPGSGKSTLTAGLIHRGWRLLTDELTLVSLTTKRIVPLVRPVSLKNQAIDIIQQFAPSSVIAAKCRNTAKGTVAYLRPPTESVTHMLEPAIPRWLIYPQFSSKADLTFSALGKTVTFSRLADGLVNYTVLGSAGFSLLTNLIDELDCYEFTYSDLNEAIAWFDRLVESDLNSSYELWQ
jgi:HprK-related kinase A